MQTWRIIDTGSNNGFYNMAVDEAMAIALKVRVVPPTLRFYTWDPPCISIGYFQKCDSMFLHKDAMEIVRRPTGGRAVFHGSDLSYSIVGRTDDPLFPGNLKRSYHTIAEALVTGLKRLGIIADPLGRESLTHRKVEYHHSPFCFAVTLGHEISANGRKLIGSAQRRWPEVFLQHGSITVTASIHEEGAARVSVTEILGEQPETKTIIAALRDGFREALGVDLREGRLTRYESAIAERLIKEKYSRDSFSTSTPGPCSSTGIGSPHSVSGWRQSGRRSGL